ncbi:PTS transporter subunit EIIB [Listeria grayi]|uniref:PTS system beta-glucoside-specific transporter subunits IIABC n=1 Tax=Listeria grayi FSL F6-1183 TaxID=1265827 RepID=A0A829RB14_LISGR|nr:PTS transporter subunit EIIB [Listeria grayi]EUJ30710.1 PTS system beta-glucoside-specific transporter subunits IIABC [Listeria grayi FSL F6-1183]
MTYQELAKIIVEKVGGKQNIISVVHCATRLRFKLKDETLAATEELKNREDVVTVMQSAGQYQVVIGTHVAQVYPFVLEASGLQGEETAVKSDKKEKLFDKLIDVISGIFTPALGALAASGMIKGLAALLVAVGATTNTSSLYTLLWAIGDTFFLLFPRYLRLYG